MPGITYFTNTVNGDLMCFCVSANTMTQKVS